MQISLVRYLFVLVALVPVELSYAENMWSGFVNSLQSSFDYQCPDSLAITGVASVFDDPVNDRRWEFSCGSGGSVANVSSSCTLQSPVHSLRSDIAFECPNEGYISGFQSTYSSSDEDRLWSPYCCTRNYSTLINCHIQTSGWDNILEDAFNWTTSSNRVLTGMTSFFSSFNRDRRWRFKQCQIQDCTRFSSFNSSHDRPLPISGQVIYTCQVNTTVLFWTSSRFELNELTATSMNSSNITVGLDNAPDVIVNQLIFEEEYCLTSQLIFTGTLEQVNGLELKCEDNNRNLIGNITISTANVPGPPTDLTSVNNTFLSVFLTTIAPTDNGGRPIQYYSINVTGGPSNCTNGICTTTSTSYNVTGLMFGVQYTFTVTANNAVGMSAPSNELVVEIPGAVPDPVSDITYCIMRTDYDQLLLQWTCPVSLTNPSITPPVTHYTAVMGNTLLCPSVNESTCSSSNDYCSIDVSDVQIITANITAVNPVGSSTARSVSINVDLELLSVTVINVTYDSVIIQCSTNYQSSANRYCYIDLTSPAAAAAVISERSMFEGADTFVTFNNLTSGSTHMFTASLVNDSNQSFPSACVMVQDSFTVESISSSITPTSSTISVQDSFTVESVSSITSSPSIIGTATPGADTSLGAAAIGGIVAASSLVILAAAAAVVLTVVAAAYVAPKRASKDLEQLHNTATVQNAAYVGQ